jgi:hypothetical protein
MTDNLDVHAMLIRAEARALRALVEHRPKTATSDYQERLAEYEDAYATACAVRRTWRKYEEGASALNRSSKDGLKEPEGS